MIVMCICHFDETNSSGGLDKQARLLSKTLRARGENVVVLASTRKWANAGWHQDEQLPIRLFWTYTTPQVSGKKLPASLIWAFQVLLWVYRHRSEISVFHSHQIRIHAFVGAIAQKLWGIPHVLKSATGGSGADIRAIGSRKYFGARGRRFIIRHTNRFIATTGTIVEDLIQYGVRDKQILTIPNGLQIPDPSRIDRPPQRSATCAFVGRISEDKNVLALARAFIASPSRETLELRIYGRGTQLVELEAILARSSASTIRYAGFTADTIGALLECGWLLLPSDAEGLSNAMLEAMASGAVPVTTRVSGCIDHIRDGVNGYFLDGVDEAAIEQGLALIANTSHEKWVAMSIAARDHAEGQFDISRVASRYIELYRALKARNGVT